GSGIASLSPEQAAKVLGISRPWVYHRMDTGRLPFRQVGTHRRVLVKDVLALKSFEEERRLFARELAEDTDEQEIGVHPSF
ncbi:helix-turn-helix domain-containing protein, partial [Microvirga massiliensis]|uniref:helix-turn-helix domain-containing protein n=1 Tax=Microvirga massiliensis TaxID=1033741 RepID=UPI00065F98BC